MDTERHSQVGLIYRALLILVVLYLSVGAVVLAVLLSKSWSRRWMGKRHIRGWRTVECPYCRGRGAVRRHDDDQVFTMCPMCDGESALVERVDH